MSFEYFKKYRYCAQKRIIQEKIVLYSVEYHAIYD